MPNGVSCAYFAVRNHKCGTQTKDIFREGIAGCQAVRTVDYVNKAASSMGNTAKGITNLLSKNENLAKVVNNVANTGEAVTRPITKFFSRAAKFARRIVYPLIIASGAYNTARAKDKVKTGAMQAGGIGTMYLFEQYAEKNLLNISKNLLNKPFFQNHKVAKIALYVAKGMGFAGASLLGYEVGSNGAEKIVDKIRAKKAKKSDNTETKQDNKTEKFPIENDLNPEKIESTLFDDMKL